MEQLYIVDIDIVYYCLLWESLEPFIVWWSVEFCFTVTLLQIGW